MATERDLAQQLLRRAGDDQAAAAALFGAEGVPDAIVGFHAQQAVEKALKAVLAVRGVEFPFTHDIGLLLALCERAAVPAAPGLAEVDLLTPYGARLRYGSEDPGPVDRATALELAGLAVQWARERVAAGDA
jgi:HEPN domain-containing protein